MKRLCSETEYLLKSQILLHHYSIQRKYLPQLIHLLWEDTLSTTKEGLLNPSLRQLHWQPFVLMTHTIYNLGMLSVTRNLSNRNVMVAHRRLPSLKDQLVKAKISTQPIKFPDQCKKTPHVSIFVLEFPNQGGCWTCTIKPNTISSAWIIIKAITSVIA